MDFDFELDTPAGKVRPSLTRRRLQIGVWELMKLVFVLSCSFGLLAMLARAVGEAREAARRAQCLCNLGQIKLALHNYHDQFECLPPAYIADASGRPMHSWRVLILPLLEQSALYNQYDFREPWDGPNNIKLLNSMPSSFACPSRYSSPRR